MTQPRDPQTGETDETQATDKTVAARLPASACPTCGKATVARHRPFCSRRCAEVDLSRWLTGRYVVPGHEPADPEDMAAALGDGTVDDPPSGR